MAKSVIDTLIAEAGSDPDGLAAVAWVIQNRAQQWGMTPEQVVKQRGQFEGYSNPGPKSVEAQKMPKVRAAAEKAWQAVTSGSVPDPTNGGTSFRAKGTKQPAPNGTVQIGGNVFALGSGASNSALAAINAVAPTPMPSRPVALGYAQNTPIPSVPAPRSSAPPGMKSLIEGNAAFGVLPFDKKPDASAYLPGFGIDLNARDLNPPIVPKARGVGTSSLAPATKVQTYKVDNLGNPIMPGAKSALQAATEAKAARIASGAEKFTPTVPVAQPPRQPIESANAPKPKTRDDMWLTSQPPTGPSIPAPQQTIMDRPGFAGIPVIGPLAVGLGAASDLIQGIAPPQASATPQPQPTKLPTVIPEKAGPPTPPRSVPKSDTSIPTFVTQFGTNTGKPAPLPPKPPKSTDRLVAGDVQKDAFVKTYYPDMYSPEAVKRGEDIASALYPKPTPRLPRLPSPAMSAARSTPLPTYQALPTVPVRTAPIAPARTPLPQTRTVNPMTQIVPAVQARAGQGLLGGLLNMLTAGNVPQANTALPGVPTPRPAWQNNPNVQRDDKWAGVLDNFGMII